MTSENRPTSPGARRPEDVVIDQVKTKEIRQKMPETLVRSVGVDMRQSHEIAKDKSSQG